MSKMKVFIKGNGFQNQMYGKDVESWSFRMEFGMMDSSSMERRKDVEGWFTQKVITTRGNGQMMSNMGLEFYRFIGEVDTKACGKTTSRTDREKKSGQMVHITKDNTKMALEPVKEFSNGVKIVLMRVNSNQIIYMVKEFTPGTMVACIRESLVQT